MKEVTIYTDGACSGNPGPGGWGAILMYGEHRKELSGNDANTTNNRMELMAAIQAIGALTQPCRIKLHTDSAYLCNGFNNGWVYGWIKNGWKTSAKKDVENQDLWKLLLEKIRPHEVTWIKVKGHSTNEFNNRCDALARAAIRRLTDD